MISDGETGHARESRWSSSVETLADALAGVSVCAIAINETGRIVFVNGAAPSVMGRAPEELVGAMLASMFDAPADQKISRFLAHGPILSGYAFHHGVDAVLSRQPHLVGAAEPKIEETTKDVSVAILRGVGDVHAMALIARKDQKSLVDTAFPDDPLQRDVHRSPVGHDMASLAAAALMHQMRTPLTTIAGFAELLSRDPIMAANPERRAQVNAILHAAAEMRGAVRRRSEMRRTWRERSRTARRRRRPRAARTKTRRRALLGSIPRSFCGT